MTKLNDDDFSVVLSAGVEFGYAMLQNVEIVASAKVEHFTDAPYVLAPGVRVGGPPIIAHDDMTEGTIGLGLAGHW